MVKKMYETASRLMYPLIDRVPAARVRIPLREI